MRKTKIICTMGPATDSDEVLEKLMRGGMNVARFNFSHGSHEEQKERMDRIKAMREKCRQAGGDAFGYKRTGNSHRDI